MTRDPLALADGGGEPVDRCDARPPLAGRPLLSFVEAAKVMALFKVLANDTRIRLLPRTPQQAPASIPTHHRPGGGLPTAA